MTSEADNSPNRDYRFWANRDQLQRMVEEAVQQVWQLRFEPGSNSTWHIHVSVSQAGQVMGDKYLDASSGPTGAKAFGPESQAGLSGGMNLAESRLDGELLVASVRELVAIIGTAHIPNEQMSAQLNADMSELQEDVEGGFVRGAANDKWSKVKDWVTRAISVGVFATEAAEKIKAVVARIESMVSLPS